MEKAIICVDDEAIIALSLQMELQKHFLDRCAVYVAFNAAMGLEIIKKISDDGVRVVLVISDYLMPGMKGDEFLLKINKLYPSVEAVMITGKADESILEELKKSRTMKAVFYKPWDENDLYETINGCLKD